MNPAVLSYRRVEALAEVGRRYGAIVPSLSTAVVESLPDVPGEARERLGSAVTDAQAQLSALTDALDRALEDLPEGEAQ